MKYLFCLLTAAILLAGCRPSGTENGTGGDEQLFAQASAAYVEKRYAEAAELFGRGRSAADSPRAAEAACWEGLSRLELGQLPQARPALEKALRSGDRNVRAVAAKGLARWRFLQGRYREAAAAYEKLGTEYAGETDAAELLAARIEALEKGGDRSGADSLRRELKKSFPGSPYANAGVEGAVGEGGWHVVQAGAFHSIAHARELQAKLRALKTESFIAIRNRNGETLYTVRCGSFRQREGALKRVRELALRGVEAVIVAEREGP